MSGLGGRSFETWQEHGGHPWLQYPGGIARRNTNLPVGRTPSDMEYDPCELEPVFPISIDPLLGYEQGYRLPHWTDHAGSVAEHMPVRGPYKERKPAPSVETVEKAGVSSRLARLARTHGYHTNPSGEEPPTQAGPMPMQYVRGVRGRCGHCQGSALLCRITECVWSKY